MARTKKEKTEDIKATAQDEAETSEVRKKRGRPKKNSNQTDSEKSSKKIETVEAEKVSDGKVKRGGVGGNGNLIPMNQRTKEEQREICTKAGVASGKKRRQKKKLREFTRDFLMQDAAPILQSNMSVLGLEVEQMSNLAAMVLRLYSKAVNNGDLNAARTLIEWAGMAPLQQERENEAIAKMSQVLQLANGDNEKEDDEAVDVVFYIPQNGRSVITDDELVTADVDQ